jgi:hypothetical protein
MRTIEDHIEKTSTELYEPGISSQRRRFLEQELEDLQTYQLNHPGDHHDPTPLELFCDQNPDALECRIYEN